jgi:hypothetical protein
MVTGIRHSGINERRALLLARGEQYRQQTQRAR